MSPEHSPTLATAGLRFAASHLTVVSVLAVRLNEEPLRVNAAAVCAPPLPEALRARVRNVFLRTNPERWRPADV